WPDDGGLRLALSRRAAAWPARRLRSGVQRGIGAVYTDLGSATLKTGERLACGVVTAPAPEWAPRIEPFLAHKRPEWRYHIAQSLQRPLDQLETRFYVGM